MKIRLGRGRSVPLLFLNIFREIGEFRGWLFHTASSLIIGSDKNLEDSTEDKATTNVALTTGASSSPIVIKIQMWQGTGTISKLMTPRDYSTGLTQPDPSASGTRETGKQVPHHQATGLAQSGLSTIGVMGAGC